MVELTFQLNRERIPTSKDATDAIVVPENKTTDSNSEEARMAWMEHFDEVCGQAFCLMV